eukprot:10509493-Heterocapsa_arctica.AAC.1
MQKSSAEGMQASSATASRQRIGEVVLLEPSTRAPRMDARSARLGSARSKTPDVLSARRIRTL